MSLYRKLGRSTGLKQRRKRPWVLAVSLLGHVTAVAAFALWPMWNLDKLAVPEDRISVATTVQPGPRTPPPGPTSTSKDTQRIRKSIPARPVTTTMTESVVRESPLGVTVASVATEERTAEIVGGLALSEGLAAIAATVPGGGGGGGRSGVARPLERDPVPLEDYSYFRVEFTREALIARVRGVIHIRVSIDRDGNVVAATVVSGVGYGLDERARRITLAFRFLPARDGMGEPVPSTTNWFFQVAPP